MAGLSPACSACVLSRAGHGAGRAELKLVDASGNGSGLPKMAWCGQGKPLCCSSVVREPEAKTPAAQKPGSKSKAEAEEGS